MLSYFPETRHLINNLQNRSDLDEKLRDMLAASLKELATAIEKLIDRHRRSEQE